MSDFHIPYRIAQFSIPLTLLIIFLTGCKSNHELIDHILSQGQPDRFQPKDISNIVANHIPLGTKKQKAIDLLKQNGFNIKKEQQVLEKCPACSPVTITGNYTEKQTLSFLPYKSFISISIGFKNEEVAYISGFQSGNPF